MYCFVLPILYFFVRFYIPHVFTSSCPLFLFVIIFYAQVSDLEPVLSMLERQNPKSTDTWETRYALLLWLSIIVKIPFHMTRLDSFQVASGPSSSSADDTQERKTVIQR